MSQADEHELRWLPVDTDTAERRRLRDASFYVHPLRRRGVGLGFLAERGRPGQHEDLAARWAASRPILLPGVLAGGIEVFEREIGASRAMFGRLARGNGRFQEELARRLARQELMVPAGSTLDRGDEREIEKVWVHAVDDEGEVLAGDLWAKLSWITLDERDASLRVRFSHGTEQLDEWQRQPEVAPWSDAYAETVFPECATISEHVPLIEAIAAVCGSAVRFSERIVYANAPDGGAVFHSDADPGQRGVVFGQFVGRTAWLALPVRELAEHVAAAARGPLAELVADPGAALDALAAADSDVELWQLLNADPAFVARLVRAGAAMVLEPGDALLLPTNGPDDSCWHSVIALGRESSLAHSYGIFAVEG